MVTKIGLFAIGLGVGSFLTIAITQPTLPIELRVGLVAISVAALFVELFALWPNKRNMLSPLQGNVKSTQP